MKSREHMDSWGIRALNFRSGIRRETFPLNSACFGRKFPRGAGGAKRA
jgi:hypothetical protein